MGLAERHEAGRELRELRSESIVICFEFFFFFFKFLHSMCTASQFYEILKFDKYSKYEWPDAIFKVIFPMLYSDC